MSDNTRSSSLKRFSFGDHIPIVLAADIDNNEVNKLFDQVSSCSEVILGGRTTVTYSTEIKLLSAFLYNFISLYADSATPGHDFCGLGLIQSKPSNGVGLTTTPSAEINNDLSFASLGIVMKKFADLFSRKSQKVYAPLHKDRSDTMLLSLLVSIVPYLISRKANIHQALSECYCALTAAEDQAPVDLGGVGRLHRDRGASRSDIILQGSDILARNPIGIGASEGITDINNSLGVNTHSSPSEHRSHADSRGDSLAVDNSISSTNIPSDSIGADGIFFDENLIFTKLFEVMRRVFNAAVRTCSATCSGSPNARSDVWVWLETLHLLEFLRYGRLGPLKLLLCIVFYRITHYFPVQDGCLSVRLFISILQLFFSCPSAVWRSFQKD